MRQKRFTIISCVSLFERHQHTQLIGSPSKESMTHILFKLWMELRYKKRQRMLPFLLPKFSHTFLPPKLNILLVNDEYYISLAFL